MKKSQLLNEIMGVPKAVDFWVDYFSIIIVGAAKGLVSKEDIEVSPALEYVDEEGNTKTAEGYRAITKIEKKEFMNWVLKIGGYANLKDLMTDSRFQQFPLYNPSVTIALYFLPQELYDLEFANRKDGTDFVEASHALDTTKKALSKVGKNQVFVNQKFTFQIYLPISELENLDTENLRKQIKPTISHELTHAYESFNRVFKSGDPYQGRETFLNTAIRLMQDDKYPQWRYFLHLVYLHLSFELNARVTQFYYSIKDKDVKNLDDFMMLLKQNSAWKELKMLEDFDAEKFIQSFQMKRGESFFDMIEDLGKQIDRERQGLPMIKMAKTPEQGMKHLIQGWDQVLQMLNLQLKSQGLYKGKLMDLVPQKAINDPYYFFKFFEKRFRKKAERFKKKLYNISTLVLDKSLMED